MTDAKFCKFCFDSGKEKALYTNHFVKEKKGGKPCCPTLAKTQCGYCKAFGHTPKHCERLATRDARRKAHEARRLKSEPRGSPIRGLRAVEDQIRRKESERAIAAAQRAAAQPAANPSATLVAPAVAPPPPAAPAPKTVVPRPPQGVWGKKASAAELVQDLSVVELNALKEHLATLGIWAPPAPPLVRQGAFGIAPADAAPLPAAAASVALPTCCDLDADLGALDGDDWGSD